MSTAEETAETLRQTRAEVEALRRGLVEQLASTIRPRLEGIKPVGRRAGLTAVSNLETGVLWLAQWRTELDEAIAVAERRATRETPERGTAGSAAQARYDGWIATEPPATAE